MMDKMKQIKIDIILSAVLCVALGVVILFWPDTIIDVFCRVFAVGVMVLGAVELFSYFFNKLAHPFAGILGLLVLLLGLWIFISPEKVVSLIPIIIGVILSIHGIQDIKLAIEAKGSGYAKWWSMLVIALISLSLGILCIVEAFGLVKFATQLIGIALIYDGISDLWIVIKTLNAARKLRQEEEALEVEYKEV